MWLVVMFDLPARTQQEIKQARQFRSFLLDEGFEMKQWSVYLRFCAGRERAETFIRRIQGQLPGGGKVDILCITDKQYEQIIRFRNQAKVPAEESPEQYMLF